MFFLIFSENVGSSGTMCLSAVAMLDIIFCLRYMKDTVPEMNSCSFASKHECCL
jgi:hypothetical protein